jgi:hypothetical protein
LNPTARKQSLRALDMRATVDRKEFFQFQRGDGRLKLIVFAVPGAAAVATGCDCSDP